MVYFAYLMISSWHQHFGYFGLAILIVFAFATPALAGTSLEDTRLYLDNLDTQIKALIRKVNSGSIIEQEAAKVTLRTMLIDRKNEMLALARQSPRLFLTLVMPDPNRTAIMPELQALVEKTTRVEGKFSQLHSDDFQTSISHEAYYVKEHSTGKHYRIYISSDNLPKTGDLVTISGPAFGTELVTSSQEVQTEMISTSTPTSSKKVAVIMFNWRNDTSIPYSQDEIRNMIFTNNDSVAAYFAEVSFEKLELTGKLRTDGDVFGYFTIPYDNISGMACSHYEWADAAEIQAVTEGVDLSGYDIKIYIFPYSLTCDIVGTATIGGNPALTWIGISSSDVWPSVITHELGHNLGLHHASIYRCAENGVPVSISGSQNCTYQEYGDQFNIMGSTLSGDRKHLDNSDKGRTTTNWLNSSENILTIDRNSSPDNIYTITPIELQSNDIQSLRIPKIYPTLGSSSDYYYLEFRRPFGFDNFSEIDPVVNGVSIRIAPDYNQGGRSLLIDTTPSTDDVFSGAIDAPLIVDKTFSDIREGVNIRAISVSPNGGQVRVWFETPPSPSSVTVVSPGADAQWQANSSQYLEWSSNNISPNNNVTVELLARYNGVPDFPPGFNSFSTPNDGSELVDLSSVSANFSYFFRLTTIVNNELIVGESQVFQITPPTPSSVTLTSPNGGEQWAKNSMKDIIWQTSNGAGGETYDLILREYGGRKTLMPIASSAGGQSYAWRVGQQANRLELIPDGQYYIRVCLSGGDQTHSCDESNRPFTVYTPVSPGSATPPKEGTLQPQEPQVAPVQDLDPNLAPRLSPLLLPSFLFRLFH